MKEKTTENIDQLKNMIRLTREFLQKVNGTFKEIDFFAAGLLQTK